MSQTNDNKRKQNIQKKNIFILQETTQKSHFTGKKKNIINTIGISNKKKVKNAHEKQ